MIYNLFPNFHVRHKGVSFYGPRMSDEGADTDLSNMYMDINFLLALSHLSLKVYTLINLVIYRDSPNKIVASLSI